MQLISLSILLCGTFTVAWSNTAVQTDWSGGDGVQGPVIDWIDQFNTASETNWLDIPGSLMLATENVMHTIDSVESAYQCLAVDMDGDGDMDVVSGGYTLSWMENLYGTGISWTTHTISATVDYQYDLDAFDIDGDGDHDLVAVSAYEITFYENSDGSGTSWYEHMAIDGLYLGNQLFAADIDGDGDGDIVYTEDLEARLSWLENTDGTGTVWNLHQIQAGIETPWDVFGADINGDSDLDIVCSFASIFENDRVMWYENVNGSGDSWNAHIVKWQVDSPTCVFAEDIDGDGDQDILFTVYVDDDVLFLENSDGIGETWVTHTISSDFNGAEIVCAGDFDNDGDMDVAGGADYNSAVYWWENTDGSGEVWTQRTLESMSNCYSIFVGDPDGDNRTEILDSGVAAGQNRVAWWDMGKYVTTGSLESSILYAQGDPGWDYIDWKSETSAGTSVALQVRASDDFSSMGDWSDTLTAPTSLGQLLEDNDSYFQYMILMETSDPDTTPCLLDVTLTWDNMGIEGEEPSLSSAVLHSFSPNPSSAPIISFSLLEQTPVEFSVLDLSGRLVISLETDDYCSGDHSIVLGELPPGTYFCHMKTVDSTAAKRFVVVD